MIKIDKDSIELQGSGIDLLTELSYAVEVVTGRVAEETGMPIEQVEAMVTQTEQFSKLKQAGMNSKESFEVVTGEVLKQATMDKFNESK